jgi:hypothetical protein
LRRGSEFRIRIGRRCHARSPSANSLSGMLVQEGCKCLLTSPFRLKLEQTNPEMPSRQSKSFSRPRSLEIIQIWQPMCSQVFTDVSAWCESLGADKRLPEIDRYGPTPVGQCSRTPLDRAASENYALW